MEAVSGHGADVHVMEGPVASWGTDMMNPRIHSLETALGPSKERGQRRGNCTKEMSWSCVTSEL